MGAGVKRLPRLLSMIGESADIDPLDIPPERRDVLESACQAWLAKQPKHEVATQAQARGLLAGAFNTIADVVRDPHYRQRGAWDATDHPATGPLIYPGRPFLLSDAPRTPPAPAPLLDEHGEIRRAARASPPPRSRPSNEPDDLPLPLAGLRVAEISVVRAGPHVTQLLAERGADVIRIEPANRVQPFTRGMEQVPAPEQVRQLVSRGAPVGYPDNDPGRDPWNRSAAFNSRARNKRSMTCDIMTPEGARRCCA